MAEAKIFAGHRVRRARRERAMTQAALADALGISASYLNLIERDQRPLTAALMLRLAERLEFDPRELVADPPAGGVDGLRRRLADPLFADLDLERGELEEWLASAPRAVEAFARAFDRLQSGGGATAESGADPIQLVRRETERWRNHFPDLDAQAESLADELRLGAGDLYGAIVERLRVRHQLMLRILPVEVMPDRLRRLDLHARQLQLSEMLDGASRAFQAAYQLGMIEAKAEIDALVAGAGFSDRIAERLFRRHLTSYFAAAVMMPYDRFLRACDGTGYDVELLQRRFNAGFEQVAHRLTTLQRVGSRGLPFFMIRVDRSGTVSKRYAGASNAALAESARLCPLWAPAHAFEQGGELVRQLVELEDGSRWLTLARTVRPQARPSGTVAAQFAIALGLGIEHAAQLVHARGLDLARDAAVPVGLGCQRCTRQDCPQRSAPPAGHRLIIDNQERGLTPFAFAGD